MIISLIRNGAKKEQYYLELGAWFLKKGVGYKPGDPFMLPLRKKGKPYKKQVWIANLYYDFRLNKITHTFTTQEPKHEKKR